MLSHNTYIFTPIHSYSTDILLTVHMVDTVSLNKKYVFVYCSNVRTYKVYIMYIKSVVYKNNDIIIA